MFELDLDMPKDVFSLFPDKNTVAILFLTAIVTSLLVHGMNNRDNAYGHASEFG